MVKDFLMENIVFRNRLKLLNERVSIYDSICSSESIFEIQIVKFNRQWSKIIRDNEFYKYWYSKHKLPNQITEFSELKDFPILTKKDIQEHFDLIFSNIPNVRTVSTGGSTGEPTQFPTSRFEQFDNYANTYTGRRWCNISPLDETVLFWGHSHMFGTGIQGQLKQCKRRLSDYLVNIKRLNAYDLSVTTLDKYFQIIKESNPKAILGYTSSIYKLAKYINENSLNIGDKSNLEAIIVTSETVTSWDIRLIEEVFGAPCVVEYGMAETGVIAYSKSDSKDLRVFWDSFIAFKDGTNILNITTINDRLFPLINYRTDDIISTKDNNSILKITAVTGRKKDILNIISNGKLYEVSGILLIHALKQYKGIFEIQFVQQQQGKVKIQFTANIEMNISEVLNFFIKNINVDFPGIRKDCFDIVQVNFIAKTIAGKEKLIIKE